MKEQHPLLPGKQKRVAFITDALSSNSFTQRILTGIALFIQKRRGIVLQQIPFSEATRDSLTGQFDGIIINLCAKETHALLDMLNGASLPIVDISAEVEDPALSVRTREAKRLMMEDRLSVKEVAVRTGFSSQAYFCYAYRAFYGHPPSTERGSRRV